MNFTYSTLTKSTLINTWELWKLQKFLQTVKQLERANYFYNAVKQTSLMKSSGIDVDSTVGHHQHRIIELEVRL